MEPVFIRFLSATPVLNYFADFYREVIPQADTRTGKWILMSTPDIPVAVVIAYLLTVTIVGPCVMRYLKILDVRKILVVYNSFVLVLNLWLGISFTWHILAAGYQFSCQRVVLAHKYGTGWQQTSKHEKEIASLLWIFHCSKIIELIDTLFLVLKRKGNQLTFLHLYHHSTIVIATWIGVKFVPGGSSAVIANVNSWIHVFMYFYYEMMVLGVKSFRNYKKFVTILQIVQFLATIVHCTTALRRDCGYPRWILTWLLLYMISFLVLFLHFYVQTYWKPSKKLELSAESNSKLELQNQEKLMFNGQYDIHDSAYSDDEDIDMTNTNTTSSTHAHFNSNQHSYQHHNQHQFIEKAKLSSFGLSHVHPSTYSNSSNGRIHGSHSPVLKWTDSIEIDEEDELISSDETSDSEDSDDEMDENDINDYGLNAES